MKTFILDKSRFFLLIWQLKIHLLLVYCTSNGTQFFAFKTLHEGFFTLKICMRKDIAKLSLDLILTENDINVTALISCKNKKLSFCWNENTRLVPIFVLSVQYTLDRYRSICAAIKCPLEITADDYIVTSNGAVYDAIQAAFIVLRIMGY